jgi:hypothetical protein
VSGGLAFIPHSLQPTHRHAAQPTQAANQAGLRLGSTFSNSAFVLTASLSAYAHPPVSPPPGLPGCGRPHRTQIRPSRWPIRTDHLRWTATRVRHICSPPVSFRRSRSDRKKNPMRCQPDNPRPTKPYARSLRAFA